MGFACCSLTACLPATVQNDVGAENFSEVGAVNHLQDIWKKSDQTQITVESTVFIS